MARCNSALFGEVIISTALGNEASLQQNNNRHM
jgi:hypothetical protein